MAYSESFAVQRQAHVVLTILPVGGSRPRDLLVSQASSRGHTEGLKHLVDRLCKGVVHGCVAGVPAPGWQQSVRVKEMETETESREIRRSRASKARKRKRLGNYHGQGETEEPREAKDAKSERNGYRNRLSPVL